MFLNFFTSFVLPVSKVSPQEVQEFILHHIGDSNKWHPLPGHLLEVIFPVFNFMGITFDKGLHGFMLLVGAFVCFLLFGILCEKKTDRAPRGLSNLLESMVLFVRDDICYKYLGEKDGERFAPFFLNFFFFILVLNFMGLVPLFSTATANINVTLGFALIVFSMMIVGGVFRNGVIGFFKGLIPSGVPVIFSPILLVLEMLGLLIKPFALTIRLFANMLAGHMVIGFLIGLVIILGYVALPALFLALFIYALEVLVAVLQAYIFTLLSAMFVGSLLSPDH